MAIEIGRRPLPAAAPHVSLFRRVYGLGSVFGKTIRDSRLGLFTIAILLGGIILAGGATMANTYGTLETRRELATLSSELPPVLRGLYGDPVRVDTLGGFISWHYGAYFALLAGLWSILALSSTLAGEARRGSLEFALATPLTRRVVAIEKVAAHLVAVIIATALVSLAAWVTGAAFAKLPGDGIAAQAAVEFGVGLGAKALIAGSIAFALAGFIGRGAAAGLAGAIMVAGYVLNGYRAVVPAFDGPASLTWFAWTRNHLPLAGSTDWAAVALVLVVSAVLLAIGIESFARRDVGATAKIRTPAIPQALLGVRGPVSRSFGELLPSALAWGIGLGLYGFVMAVSSRVFAEELTNSPGLLEAVRNMVPGVDMTTTAGFLQLAFVDLGLVLVALAAATFVAGRASDETGGRLELLLSTPLTRARWTIASAIGVWLAIVVTDALLAASIGVGVGLAGSDPVQPLIGSVALALYGAAMAGIGLAVGGLTRASFAAPAVLVVAIGSSLVDILGDALGLPDWFRQLALSSHMGEPMVGTWDPAGVAACLVLAVGGLGLGLWGMRRRDVSP
ncbi:MAG TPA: ABC transporter permease subunit [Candidatus Limnocylindrales bacterium]